MVPSLNVGGPLFRDAPQLMLKKALTQTSLKRSSQVLGKY